MSDKHEEDILWLSQPSDTWMIKFCISEWNMSYNTGEHQIYMLWHFKPNDGRKSHLVFAKFDIVLVDAQVEKWFGPNIKCQVFPVVEGDISRTYNYMGAPEISGLSGFFRRYSVDEDIIEECVSIPQGFTFCYCKKHYKNTLINDRKLMNSFEDGFKGDNIDDAIISYMYDVKRFTAIKQAIDSGNNYDDHEWDDMYTEFETRLMIQNGHYFDPNFMANITSQNDAYSPSTTSTINTPLSTMSFESSPMSELSELSKISTVVTPSSTMMSFESSQISTISTNDVKNSLTPVSCIVDIVERNHLDDFIDDNYNRVNNRKSRVRTMEVYDTYLKWTSMRRVENRYTTKTLPAAMRRRGIITYKSNYSYYLYIKTKS